MGFSKNSASLASLLVINISLFLMLINNTNGVEAFRLMKKKMDDQSRRVLLNNGVALTPQMG